jgi:hypothetical protein
MLDTPLTVPSSAGLLTTIFKPLPLKIVPENLGTRPRTAQGS